VPARPQLVFQNDEQSRAIDHDIGSTNTDHPAREARARCTEGPARKADPPVDARLAQQAQQRAAEIKELAENPIDVRKLPPEKAQKRVGR
jgi:hypothetical protein